MLMSFLWLFVNMDNKSKIKHKKICKITIIYIDKASLECYSMYIVSKISETKGKM